jgi:hypothetical protein
VLFELETKVNISMFWCLYFLKWTKRIAATNNQNRYYNNRDKTISSRIWLIAETNGEEWARFNAFSRQYK